VLFESFALQTINHLPIRQKTFATYHSSLRLHIFPTLAHRDIRNITRLDIQSAIHGLPPQTSATALAVMKTVLEKHLLKRSSKPHPPTESLGPRSWLNHVNF
jgi:hypothetical protein